MKKGSFFLGDVELPSPVLYAPLAGCSDYPFRQMACEFRPGIVYCEMVKIDALVRHDPHTYRLLDYDPSMHPIGAQICGSKPKMAKEAARIIEELGFDVIDLNCGCPVDKVTKDGSGSGMLKNLEGIGEILSEMVGAVKIPVTVKIRAGWDENSIVVREITQIAEKAGAKAIAVHGRTRQQAYKGAANWEYIRQAKEAAKEILVIGNGDLFDADAVTRMVAMTSCDAVLISRGTLGQPWIVEDILRKIEGEDPVERGPFEIKQALLNHFHKILAYQDDRQALLDFRRVGCWYLKHLNGAKELRGKLNQALSPKEVFHLIETFAWETVSKEVECIVGG